MLTNLTCQLQNFSEFARDLSKATSVHSMHLLTESILETVYELSGLATCLFEPSVDLDKANGQIERGRNEELRVVAATGLLDKYEGQRFNSLDDIQPIALFTEAMHKYLPIKLVAPPDMFGDIAISVAKGKQAFYALPLMVNNALQGSIFLCFAEDPAFAPEEEHFVSLLASLVSANIGRFASHHNIAITSADDDIFNGTPAHWETAKLETVSKLSDALRRGHYSDELVKIFLEQTVDIVQAKYCMIFRLARDNHTLNLWDRYPRSEELPSVSMAIGEGVTGYVAETGHQYDSRNASTLLQVNPLPQEQQLLDDDTNLFGYCLQTSQGKTIGVMHVGFDKEHVISGEVVYLLSAITEMAGNVLNRASTREELEQRVMERTRALMEANEQLKELDKLKSKFMTDVSHELRTPVTNIQLYLNLLERARPEQWSRYLSILKKQTNSLTRLVENVLDLSRLVPDNDAEESVLIDLNRILEYVAEMHRARAEEKGLQILFEEQKSLPKIYGQNERLGQVFANLVVNAINYTEAGYILIKLEQKMQEIYVTIQDTGVGISQEDLPEIFKRFYRGKQSGGAYISGTGLGLSIVKEIIDSHGGQIEVQSEINVGTQMIVRLPIYSSRSEEAHRKTNAYVEAPTALEIV